MRRSCTGLVAFLILLLPVLLPVPALADHAGPLAAQWHLDEPLSGGTSTPDSSGHGLTATNPRTISIASGGRFANHLSSTHVGAVQPTASSLLQPQRVTVLGWVRNSGSPGTLAYVAGQGDDGTTCLGSSYAMYTGTSATDGLIFYIRPTVGNFVTSPNAGNGIWDGQWHMVAGVFDGSSVRLYVDGAQVGAASPAPGATINYGFSGNRFYFGSYPPVGCGSGDFPGGIDELRIYRRALSTTEIARLAAASGPAPPVLVPDAVELGPGPGPGPGPAPVKLEDLLPPKLGRLTNVAPVRGNVLVAVPKGTASSGSARISQKGLSFVPLREARQIPVGSFLDTRAGTVRLRSARDGSARSQTGDFSSGLFQVLQSRRRSARGLTDLVLKGGSFARSRCTLRSRSSAGAARRRLQRRTIRRLRSNARGRFRTRGRYSSATVRGTVWGTSDRCDGTLTKVTRGSVVVRNLRRRRNIVIRAGKRTRGTGGGRGSYLARAP